MDSRNGTSPQAGRTRFLDGLLNPVQAEPQKSPALSILSMPQINRNMSGQSLADLTMAEAPAQTPPPRSFAGSTFSTDEANLVTQLLAYLAENSYAYDSYVQVINLLHRGFNKHIFSHADARRRPYEHMNELRQAREAMDSRFAVGEDLLLDWVSDEAVIAQTCEDRLKVTELFDKAVKDEPASVDLWQKYLDWLEQNHKACHDGPTAESLGWSKEDNEICRDLFTQDVIMETLEKAITATQWRLDRSWGLWRQWAVRQMDNLSRSTNIRDDYNRLLHAFLDKLKTPHMNMESTQGLFWELIQKYQPNDWESAMAQSNEISQVGKKQTEARTRYEEMLQRAQIGTSAATYETFNEYMSWEKSRKPKQRSEFDNHLRCALYERTLLRFPTLSEWWIEYIDFVISNSPQGSVLPLIERATKHCPWSGDLWAIRIIRSDVERRSHEEIESTKHRATASGLADVGGIDELLKLLEQWCSYLRRLAFLRSSTEDELMIAEIGIISALEDIQQAGGAEAELKKYSLQNIQIKFYTEGRQFTKAREVYRELAPLHGYSAEFWARYYQWELWLWGYERLSEARRIETQENGPHLATAVLQEAMSRRDLDDPYRIIAMYQDHFQLHESADKLEAAMIRAREVSKAVARRRAKEEAAAAESAAQTTTTSFTAAQASQPSADVEMTEAVGQKRKASLSYMIDQDSKRSRNEASIEVDGASQASETMNMKRDREHNTVTMRNLPADVQELDIKKFFRDIDQPLSIAIIRDTALSSASATVEFASREDVLAAKTKNGKQLAGETVQIHGGSQATLYVTNYPPHYDEAAVRGLFDAYGEIASVRFPSLKFNSRRRFCYVSFLSSEMAASAESAMDGKMLDDTHKLVAKISNPDAKKQRSGAEAEGREIFVKNLDNRTSEDEVRSYFSDHGEIVSMHLLKNVKGQSTGRCFIVFSDTKEAQAALLANNKPFKERVLQVEIANKKNAVPAWDKARKTDIIVKHDDHASSGGTPAPEGTDTLMSTDDHKEDKKTTRERSAAILNLPDTVNDARIRTVMEEYGQVVKIQLRRREGGAIIEFANLQDAFKVRSGVDCSSLGPEVKTGDVQDLFKKRTVDTTAPTNGKSVESSALSMRPAGVIARPTQARGGRRGGLGLKRGGLGGAISSSSTTNGEVEQSNGTGKEHVGGKSNDDFRAMLEQSRKVK